MTEHILENAFIERLAAGFPRSPLQLNRLQESDAELVRLPGSDTVLAFKTDCLVEEIETGLYADPYLMGWMAVIVNASDLAAVGAAPLGVLLSETLPPDAESAFLDRLQEGMRDACAACGLPLLGGDTNFSRHVQLGAFAVGTIPAGAQLSRLGARPGDQVFATAPFGLGSVFAFGRLAGGAAAAYRPLPRLREGQLLRGYASACMDTSDGAIATLDQLARLNGIGFDLPDPLERVLHPDALRLARGQPFPDWVMLAGPHGRVRADLDGAAGSGGGGRRSWSTPAATGGRRCRSGWRRRVPRSPSLGAGAGWRSTRPRCATCSSRSAARSPGSSRGFCASIARWTPGRDGEAIA